MDVRPARTSDISAIRALMDAYAPDRRLLSKATVTLYESTPEFVVAVDGDSVIGCGALHVMWEDLAEVRSVAVSSEHFRRGVGSAILRVLLDRARELGVGRVFCLTFETSFFESFGFVPISHDKTLSTEVYEQLLQSYDEGVAEFLDLERVKPNTLGNTRMLLHL